MCYALPAKRKLNMEPKRSYTNAMKKRVITLLLAAALTVALCACGGGQSSQTAQPTPADDQTAGNTGSTGEAADGGELTVGIAADLDSSLDPHVSSSSAGTREVLFNIYEGLVKPDTQGNLVPAVAEGYTANDTVDQYTFTLREGVRFHDGSEVTAGDVVYSLSRAAGLETGEPLMSTLSGITSVEATDDKTVVVTLSAPDVEFPAYMTAAIIPEGSDPADGIIGTGPFKYVSRSPQENIVMERFDDYWGEKAQCAKVTFKVIEDGQTMVMSLRSGAIDLAAHLEASQVAELTDLTVQEGSMNLVQAVYLNNAQPPFDDIRVRQALCYAIDKQQVIDLAGDGHGTPVGSSMYPAFGRFFDAELVDYYQPDTAKALELLAEAGYDKDHPLEFTIIVPSNYTPHVDAAQVVVNLLDLLDGAVKAQIQQVEWATWYSDVYQGRQFEATVCGMDASTLTGSAMLARFVSDNAKNFIGFENADYDAAYAAALADGSKLVESFDACQQILAQQAANVYIQDLAEFVVMQPNVSGYRFYPLYVMDLACVAKTA